MAGDWIKMRVSLVTHPKVINLAETLSYDGDYQDWSGLHGFIPAIGGTKQDFDEGVMQALRVTRYVTVTALLKFWGYANEHAKGEFIPALRINDIDEITQVPGFGAALESIGWAVYDEDNRGIFLPNFAEHNATASDRGAAARQKRYREKKKTVTEIDDVTRDVTRDVTVTDREEKRREEKNIEETDSKRNKQIQFNGEIFTNLDGYLDSWKVAYPHLNVEAEIAKAAAWYVSNPSKQKKQHARFLNGWLSRAKPTVQEIKPTTPMQFAAKYMGLKHAA